MFYVGNPNWVWVATVNNLGLLLTILRKYWSAIGFPGHLTAFLTMWLVLWSGSAQAVTYANVSTTFNWIDASTHTKLGPTTGGAYSPLYRFSNTGGCGSTPPYIDDSMSDNIPIGFTFMYGGVNFTQVRIMTNGRLQFNNNITCGYGSPVTQLPYPNAGLNYTMRIYGGDLDPSLQGEIGLAYITDCTTRASCYVSYALLGTAPYRSFVVTWSNVPEWTTATSASGSYSVQAILQENGEFVYQYGPNIPGPGNTVAQTGWQVDSNDFEVPAVGFPANNSAIKFYIPRPVAEYRMEQLSWNGTAGEVLDTSGNGRHGTAVSAGTSTRPTEEATGRVCRGGQIANNTTTADISAINTGVSIPTAVGSVGTISFWYNNSSGDRMLFDASVSTNRWFYLRRTANSALSFVVTDSVNTNRTVTTANNVIPNTGWIHIAVTWNFNSLAANNSDRLRIYVNGVLSVTSAFTSAGTLSPSIDTLYIGDNRSSISPVGASAGNPGGANATIDEFRIYNFEGGRALVQRDMIQAGACLSHYAISHAGTGRACDSNTVTIEAHDAAHSLVTMPNNTTLIQLSTSTGKGDWSLISGYGVLDNGTANDGVATYLFNGEYQVSLGLTHATPGAVNINATDGQIVESEDPPLTLSSCVAVTKFNACHNYSTSNCSTAGGRLHTRLAGNVFSSDVVALDSAGSIDGGFTGKAVVSLIARATPGTVDASNCFVPGFTQTLDNAATSFAAGRLTVNATVASAYQDARIRVVCDSSNCPPAGLTSCSADNLAIRPLAFAITSTNAINTGTSGTPTFKAGSDNFNLTASAVAGYGGTPLVGNTLTIGTPTAGVISGSFGAASVATGIAVGNSFTYSEVGNLGLNANAVYDDSFTSVDQPGDCTDDFSNTLVGGRYGCKIGSLAVAQTTGSSGFGRFIPNHFVLSAASITQAGGSFSYMDQPFGVAFTLTAVNASGGTTTNYAGSYAKLDPAIPALWPSTTLGATGFGLGAKDGVSDLSTRLAVDGTPTGTWSSGAAAVTANLKFSRPITSTADATWGPYDVLDIGIAPQDADGVKLLPAALNLDADSNSTNERQKLSATSTRQRFGRLRLINAYGSELLRPRVEYRAEYWAGNRWTTNTLDATSPIVSGNIVTGGLTVNGVTPLTAGVGFITFSPAAMGSYDIALNLSVIGNDTSCNAAHGGTAANRPWLKGFWTPPANCGGVAAWAQDPNARIRLGSPKAPYIYLRERY